MHLGSGPPAVVRRPCPGERRTWLPVLCAIGFELAGLLGCAPGAAIAGPATCRGPTDDTLRPVPPTLVPAVIAAFRVTMTPAEVERTGVIRCAGGAVLACLTGANLNCGPADTRRHNPGATHWCRTHANASFVPLFAAGHASVFAWHCVGTGAVPERVVQRVDMRGFAAEHWRVVAAPAGPSPG